MAHYIPLFINVHILCYVAYVLYWYFCLDFYFIFFVAFFCSIIKNKFYKKILKMNVPFIPAIIDYDRFCSMEKYSKKCNNFLMYSFPSLILAL